VIGHFLFIGDTGTTLIGMEAELLAATTKGRPNFVPPALTAISGKRCVIVADVTDQIYDADPAVLYFKVAKCEMLKDTATNKGSSSSSNLASQAKKNVPSKSTEYTQDCPEETKDPKATPPRDIVDTAGTDTEEVNYPYNRSSNQIVI
jgi:hypothetical protein